MAEHGRIDVLVNNAGQFILHKSEDMPEDDWRLQIDVMLNGVFFMTQAVARAAMIPQQRGSVVNIASIGGMGGWPMRSAYNAAKAGVIVLTEVLATEWAQYNIRLNCVSPGVTRTEMMDAVIKQGVANVQKYANRTPLGRVAEVLEIANAVLFLASDRASYITGENLRVDGGWVPWANMRCVGFPE
jgi:NAD(P)-dependent dehydrogenase (short-subunit alcohol dehydrogenase family)